MPAQASAPTKLSVEVEFKAKPSLPIQPSPSPEGTIGADIVAPIYSPEQHETWRRMFARQSELLPGRVCDEYLEGRALLRYTSDRIPALADLSERLHGCTGWRVIRVEGYVPEDIFFGLLARKLFPCTDFIRHISEIEYTPAPDMFHDLMGHLPMIANPRFASFFHSFGLAGINARTDEEVQWLGRIYWYTVEFGLLNPTAHDGAKRDPRASRIYGAGLTSSVGEMEHCFTNEVKRSPFSIEVIAATDVEIHHMQEELFEIASFDELETSFHRWAVERGLLAD